MHVFMFMYSELVFFLFLTTYPTLCIHFQCINPLIRIIQMHPNVERERKNSIWIILIRKKCCFFVTYSGDIIIVVSNIH